VQVSSPHFLQLPAAAADAPNPAEFPRLGVLHVRLCTSPRPSGRKLHQVRSLVALATKFGEICGLAGIFVRYRAHLDGSHQTT